MLELCVPICGNALLMMSCLQLPPALFSCGTLDPLLDDSVMMSAKWAMSGAESILKIYPGAPHGFTFFVGSPSSVNSVRKTDACRRSQSVVRRPRRTTSKTSRSS